MTSYDFYVSNYHGGAVPEAEWPIWAARARDQLRRYRRMYQVRTPWPRAADMAVCAMAEALYSFQLLLSGEAGPVQSASIGSVSVSYGSAQGLDLSPGGQERELYRCAARYLDIYRGCG